MLANRRSPFAATSQPAAKSLDDFAGRLLDDCETRRRYPRLARWLEASRAERLYRLEALRHLARNRGDLPPDTRRQLGEVSRVLEGLRPPNPVGQASPGHSRSGHFTPGHFEPSGFEPGLQSYDDWAGNPSPNPWEDADALSRQRL